MNIKWSDADVVEFFVAIQIESPNSSNYAVVSEVSSLLRIQKQEVVVALREEDGPDITIREGLDNRPLNQRVGRVG